MEHEIMPTIEYTAIFNNFGKPPIRTYEEKRFKFEMEVNPIIPPKAQNLLFDILNNIIHDTIEKFEKGQIEHGGNLMERNLDVELHQESLDSIIYSTANKIKKLTYEGIKVNK